MNELLKSLYDNYYEGLPLTDLKSEVDRCRKLLIERLEKPERRLILQIIDSKTPLRTVYPWTASSLDSVWLGN